MTETKIYDTEYNVSAIGVPSFPGKLVIWSSYLYHETKKRIPSEERYTISFNTLDKFIPNAIRN